MKPGKIAHLVAAILLLLPLFAACEFIAPAEPAEEIELSQEMGEEDFRPAEEAYPEPEAAEPLPSEVPSAEPQPEPVETVEEIDPRESEIVPLFSVDCNTWANLDVPSPINIEEISADGEFLDIRFDMSEMEENTPLSFFVDFSGPDVPLSESPVESYRGANYGTAVNLQGDTLLSSAAFLVPNQGEFVQLSTTVDLVVEGYLNLLRIAGADIPREEDSLRIFMTMDGETCFSFGDPAVNDAYVLGNDINPTVGDFLAGRDGVPVCNLTNNACLFVPDAYTFTRTGDFTFDVTINGVVYTVQFDVTPGLMDVRLGQFEDAGWLLANPSSNATPLHNWDVRELQAEGASRGFLGVADTGSQVNPLTFAVSMFGQNPLTPEEIDTISMVLKEFLETFRSAYEISQ